MQRRIITRRYIKKTPAQIHEAMQRASQTDEAIRLNNEMNELKNASLEEAAQRAVSLNPDALAIAVSMDSREKLLWRNVGIGICPWDGTRCHDGGPCLRKDKGVGKDKSIFGPVPGGDQNCVLCRHFITTPAWDEDLDWYFNVLSRRLTAKSARAIEVDGEMDDLRRAHQTADAKERIRIDREISALEQEEGALQADCALLVRALCNTKDYIAECGRIKSKRPSEVMALTHSSSTIRHPSWSSSKPAISSKLRSLRPEELSIRFSGMKGPKLPVIASSTRCASSLG